MSVWLEAGHRLRLKNLGQFRRKGILSSGIARKSNGTKNISTPMPDCKSNRHREESSSIVVTQEYLRPYSFKMTIKRRSSHPHKAVGGLMQTGLMQPSPADVDRGHYRDEQDKCPGQGKRQKRSEPAGLDAMPNPAGENTGYHFSGRNGIRQRGGCSFRSGSRWRPPVRTSPSKRSVQPFGECKCQRVFVEYRALCCMTHTACRCDR